MPVSSFSRLWRKHSNFALEIGLNVFAFAHQFEQRIEVGDRSCRLCWSFSSASSSRLRSCMTFWLRSGEFQKSGELISSSVF